MNLHNALMDRWHQIGEAERRILQFGGHIGTGLQIDMQEAIRPLLPNGVSYRYEFDFSGRTAHVFYESENPSNELRL